VNDAELFLRVGELAGRVGYPMPSISPGEGTTSEACICLRTDGGGPGTLVLHDHVDEVFPRAVRDFLITQEFVQARAGVLRHRRRIKRSETVIGGVAALSAVLIAGRFVASAMLAGVLGLAVAYLGMAVLHLLLVGAWSRWFTRRSDQTLVEILGRQQVVEALQWFAARKPPFHPRWLWNGAPPHAPERLRWLAKEGANA
jgi:hypothetical protein